MADTFAIELWDKSASVIQLNDNHTILYDKYLKFITDYSKSNLPAINSQKRLTEKILSETQDLDYNYYTCINFLIERISELTNAQETFSDAMMREVDDVAKLKIVNIKKETKEWRINRKKIADDLVKENQKIDNHFKRYQAKHTAKQTAHSAYVKAENNKSLSVIQVENYKNSAFLRNREYENERNDYKQALENFNNYQANYYSKSLPQWGSQGKQIENDRYSLLKSNFTNLSELCKSLSSKFGEIAEKLEFGMEGINVEEDFITLIGKEKTGDVPPRDIPFRDLNEASNKEEECDPYGVLWSGCNNGSVSHSMTSSQQKQLDGESSKVKQGDDQSSLGKGNSVKDGLSRSLTNGLPSKPPRTSSIAVSSSGPTENVPQGNSTNSSASSVTSNPAANGSSRKSSLPSGIPGLVKKNSNASNNTTTTGTGLLSKLFGGIRKSKHRKSKDGNSSNSLDKANKTDENPQPEPTEPPVTEVYADPDDFLVARETIEVVKEAAEDSDSNHDAEDSVFQSNSLHETVSTNKNNPSPKKPECSKSYKYHSFRQSHALDESSINNTSVYSIHSDRGTKDDSDPIYSLVDKNNNNDNNSSSKKQSRISVYQKNRSQTMKTPVVSIDKKNNKTETENNEKRSTLMRQTSRRLSRGEDWIKRRSQSVSHIFQNRILPNLKDGSREIRMTLRRSSRPRQKGDSSFSNRHDLTDGADETSSGVQHRKIEVLRDTIGPVEIVSTPAEAMKSAVRVVSMYSSEYDQIHGVTPSKQLNQENSIVGQSSPTQETKRINCVYYYEGSCVAIHEYSSSDSAAIYLSFAAGDQFYIIQEKIVENAESGWILVEKTDKSEIGYVPESYMDRRSFEEPIPMSKECDPGCEPEALLLQVAVCKTK